MLCGLPVESHHSLAPGLLDQLVRFQFVPWKNPLESQRAHLQLSFEQVSEDNGVNPNKKYQLECKWHADGTSWIIVTYCCKLSGF